LKKKINFQNNVSFKLYKEDSITISDMIENVCIWYPYGLYGCFLRLCLDWWKEMKWNGIS